MKWVFYVIVFIYMAYRAVYGVKLTDVRSITVDPIDYGEYETYVPPNSYKSIACKYTNKYQKVEWINPSGNTIPLSLKKRVATQKHPGPQRAYTLSLIFSDTEVDDTGEYECRSGDVSKKVTLCVIGPAEFVDTPTEVSMDEGRSYTLSCQARGQPEPRIVWMRNGQEISSNDSNIFQENNDSNKYKIMTKYNRNGFEGLLTITSLTPEDSGEYTCMAIQEHTTVEDCSLTRHINISLVVNYAPVFERNETVIFSKNNESVEFVCSAGGHPEPTYRWFHALDDNTLFEYPKESIVYSKVRNEANFTTLANPLSFGQKYVCEATNQYGTASSYYTLLKIEKPKTPEVFVYNNTESSISLLLGWPDSVLFPVEEIEVQVTPKLKKRLPKEADWKKPEDIGYEMKEELDEKAYVVTVGGLEPESDYWIRVRVGNELGFSSWTSPEEGSTSTVEEITEKSTTEASDEDDTENQPLDGDNTSSNDSMFYGIFFAGGILVLSFICMLAMKLV
ncbi:unnamed protein product [Diatraea saccharalis]|uniref:Hemolin n=1 Tax=Diatraea saccharalis TaxID=40085 RepID=A0A9N9QXV9_9NEOP|nr:unnamed protein product [Diatraea saccharalis]